MKKWLAILALLVLVMTAPAGASVIVAGITFADNAFPNTLISSVGTFTTAGGTLDQVLTDNSVGTYAFSFSPGASATLGFPANTVFNGPGNDLALFELGIPDTFQLTLNGITHNYPTSNTGFTVLAADNITWNINDALINLDDFGIPSGAFITQNTIGLSIQGPGTVPSLALEGALNVVPVPPSVWLMGSGLLGLLGWRRFRKS